MNSATMSRRSMLCLVLGCLCLLAGCSRESDKLVGRWRSWPQVWEFHSDGRFEMTALLGTTKGEWEYLGDSKVRLRSPIAWDIGSTTMVYTFEVKGDELILRPDVGGIGLSFTRLR